MARGILKAVALVSVLAFVTTSNGSSATRQTDTSEAELLLRVSPDGNRIAYISAIIGGPSQLSLWLMNADGSQQRRLVDNAYRPVWSPDGLRIAYEYYPFPSTPTIWTVYADGSAPAFLTTGSYASWSPDGSQLVVSGGSGAGIQLAIVNADGTGRRDLVPGDLYDSYGQWSWATNKIVFHSTRAGTSDIWTINPDGSGLTNLTNSPVNDANAQWSPDGSKIIFWRALADGVHFMVMNADGSGIYDLLGGMVLDVAGDDDPSWSADGSRIVYGAPADAGDIYVVNVDGSELTNLTNTPDVYENRPVWSSNDSRVHFVSQPRSGNDMWDIFVIEMMGSQGSVSGHVGADCPASETPLFGARVDAYEVGTGDLAGTAVTDAAGAYLIEDLPGGDYIVNVVVPLGYMTSTEEVPVTISGGEAVAADFGLQCVPMSGSPRTSGFWKHQLGVATGGRGQSQIDATGLCAYLDLIAAHFNSNAVNQVIVYEPPGSGECTDKLQVAKELLNLTGSVTMRDRAKQQLIALLLNVAAGYTGQMQVISTDGVTVSHAITYCDNLIDSPSGDQERAKTIAELVNSGQQLPTGMVPVGTPGIAYGRRPVRPAEGSALTLAGAVPNPAWGRIEVVFSLPDDASAVLEVLDISGRLVYRRNVGGKPGTNSVHLGENGARLPMGAYLVRLTHRGNSLVRRVVVIE